MNFPLVKVCALLSSTLAMLLLGGIIGWLMGNSQGGAGISLLAALLTALVALGAYMLDARKPKALQHEGRTRDADHGTMPRVCAMSTLAILFLFGLFMGVKAGEFEQARERHAEEFAHTKHLANCSRNQKRLNMVRKELELAPLGSEMFCRKYPS